MALKSLQLLFLSLSIFGNPVTLAISLEVMCFSICPQGHICISSPRLTVTHIVSSEGTGGYGYRRQKEILMVWQKTTVPVPVLSITTYGQHIFFMCKMRYWLDWLYGSSDLKYYDLDKLQIVQKLPFRMISLPDG